MSKVKNYKVATIQMDCELGNTEENIKTAEIYINKAYKMGAKLVILPELFNTGYRVEEDDSSLAEKIPGKTTNWLQQQSQNTNMMFITAIMECGEINGLVYDTAVIIDENGIVGSYKKSYLWDQEKIRFTPGNNDFPVFKTDLGNIGLQICYELGFPEPSRKLALNGADIIAFPSAFGKARTYVWDIANSSRAIENGVFTLSANRIGQDKDTQFAGHSKIVSPSGKILDELADSEGITIADINLDEVTEQRKKLPYLRDLDKSLYNNIGKQII